MRAELTNSKEFHASISPCLKLRKNIRDMMRKRGKYTCSFGTETSCGGLSRVGVSKQPLRLPNQTFAVSGSLVLRWAEAVQGVSDKYCLEADTIIYPHNIYQEY